MKLTYGDVMRGMPAMFELLRLKPAPTIALAAKITRNCRLLQQAAQDYEATLKRQKEAEPTCDREALGVELMAVEIDVEIHVVTLAELVACEEKRPAFELPAGILYDLAFMFELEEPLTTS
jgi:hypothetical protein